MELELHSTEAWETDAALLGLPSAARTGPSTVLAAKGTDVEVPFSDTQRLRLMTSTPEPAPDTSTATRRATARDVVPRDRSELANRALNVAIAVIAVVFLAPVMLLIAVMVKLSSAGPVFYIQTRVGMDRRRRNATALFDRRRADVGGRQFNIIKFRSMRVDAEQGTGAVWATQNDPRVTSFGRFMRKTRLDELPQLFNVIRGDMNIVGPRPERPSIFAQLRQNIQEYPLRQRARPGITGWAQINQAYDSSIDDVRSKVQFDLEYLERQSVMEDLKIMARTLPVMIFKRGSC